MSLDEDINIYVLIAKYNNTKYINPVTDDFNFVILFENGDEISINRTIISNISAPIKNLELSNYKYAIEEEGGDNGDFNLKNVLLEASFTIIIMCILLKKTR